MNDFNNQKDIRFFTFLLLSLVLFVFESLLPRPIPWVKIGLANIMVVSAFDFFPLHRVSKLVLYRVIVGNLFLGTIGSPGFLLSLSGSIASLGVMVFLYVLGTRNKMVLSIHGGVFHLLGQLVVARQFLLQHLNISYFLPLLILFGSISGLIIGLLANGLAERLKEYPRWRKSS